MSLNLTVREGIGSRWNPRSWNADSDQSPHFGQETFPVQSWSAKDWLKSEPSSCKAGTDSTTEVYVNLFRSGWRIELYCHFWVWQRRRKRSSSRRHLEPWLTFLSLSNSFSRQMMQHRLTASNRHNPPKTQRTSHSRNGCMSQIYPSDSGIQISDKCLG